MQERGGCDQQEMKKSRMKKHTRRNKFGSANISEFGAVLVMLLTCLVLPLLNLAIIPVRYAVARSIVSTEARNLAKCESLSEAMDSVDLWSEKHSGLQALGGIDLKTSQLTLTVEESQSKITHSYSNPRSIPQNLLPDGKSNCTYMIELEANLEIHPLITASYRQARIPGLSGPISLRLREVAAWENLSRDPLSGEFFVNQ
jgi:hypothetical protein